MDTTDAVSVEDSFVCIIAMAKINDIQSLEKILQQEENWIYLNI